MNYIVAAVAPVWASVEAARDGQRAFGIGYSSYVAGVAGLLVGGRSQAGRLDTVALWGEPVQVLETVEAGVLRVELPAQPNGDTGYRGFVDAGHLGDRAPEPGPISTPAGPAMASATPLDRSQIYDLATSFVGVPYLWGGIEGAGIDCSGLIHIAARLGGRTIPRDAHHQWAATRADLTWGDLETGDILYFGDRASLDGIVHVGFWAGDGSMLHAPEEGRNVVVEPLTDRLRERCVAFGRIVD